MSSALCESCQQKPKFSDGITTHPYCSKTCASRMNPSQPRRPSVGGSIRTASGSCEVCKIRQKYQDASGFTHPYCGKACAAVAAKAAPAVPPTSSTTAAGTTGSNTVTSKKGACKAPGCQKQAFANADGTLADYCSQAHKKLGESLCLMCRKAVKLQRSHFCGSTCESEAERKGPMILEVPKGHMTFQSVEEQFKSSWRHTGKPSPAVRRIYKIITPLKALASYNAYRAMIEVKGDFEASGRSAGNENRRWHGTRRECNVGDKGQTSLCSSTNCPLCSIIRNSFDLSLWGTKTGWGRFGKGIYTSSTSSKSDDYSSNDAPSKLKAILLNKVVVGKGCKMKQDNSTLTAPPPGYDSVLAEKGGSLNYDELVVYRNDAIRPSFLVMYDKF